MGTATKIRDIEGRRQKALYSLDPPLDDGTEFVLVSAVDLDFAGIESFGYRTSETMVFPADGDGEVTNWGELGFVPYKSHAAALDDMGYTVA